jgi:hypothetical protein
LIESCPKFSTCSAPICPLDEHWRNSAHLSGERVCLWLREAAKDGGAERIRATLPGDISTPLLSAYHDIMSSQRIALPAGIGAVRHVLERAALSGSKLGAFDERKLDQGTRLRATLP